jgi:hypothetical protein
VTDQAIQPAAPEKVRRSRQVFIGEDGVRRTRDGRAYCTGHSKNKGGALCLNVAGQDTEHLGEGKCYNHGGRTPSGPASPHWKGKGKGKDAKAIRAIMSPELRARFLEARNDPEILELLDDIALFKARRDELLARLGSAESGATWHVLANAYRALRAALAEIVTSEKVIAALMEIESAIQTGSSEYERWTQIVQIVNHRARLVESERQRLVEQQQVLTAKQAETLMAMLEAAVRKYISDPKTLDLIGQELARTVGAGPGATIKLLR